MIPTDDDAMGSYPGDRGSDGYLPGGLGADEDLDQILGEDLDPSLPEDAKRAIVLRVRATEEAALDRLLDLDGVAVPEGLSGRVLAGLEHEVGALAGDLFIPAAPRRRRLYLVGVAVAAAAAAALLTVVLTKRTGAGQSPGSGVAPHVAEVNDPLPSDEFLALLPALENVDFLIDELDPLEAEALFLFETEDDLLLDLLDENG